MDNINKVKKNYIYQTAYQVLLIALPLITTPYISRVLGAEGVGTYSYTFSVVSYFVLFSKLGIHTYGNREIAMVRDNRKECSQIFADLYAIHFMVSIVVMSVYCGYIFFFPNRYKMIFIIQSFYILGELLDINWFFCGIEKFKLTILRNVVIKIISLIAIFMFVKTKEDILAYCCILALATFFSEGTMWFFVFKYVDIVKPNMKSMLRHLKPLITFFIPSIAVSLYRIMDKIMLGVFGGNIQVGYYENSEKVVDLCLSLITSLGTVMMPRMTYMIRQESKEEYKKIIESSMKYIMIISSAMCSGLIGISSVFVPIFFGKDFDSCVYLLKGLALVMPVKAFADVLRTQYLIPNHRDREFQISIIIGAIINFVFNFIFIAKLKAVGAMIGTILAEYIVCIIQSYFAKNELDIKKYIKMSLPYLGIGSIMMCSVIIIGKLLNENIITLFVQVLVGGIIYLTGIVVYLYKYDKKFITTIGPKLKRKGSD